MTRLDEEALHQPQGNEGIVNMVSLYIVPHGRTRAIPIVEEIEEEEVPKEEVEARPPPEPTCTEMTEFTASKVKNLTKFQCFFD